MSPALAALLKYSSAVVVWGGELITFPFPPLLPLPTCPGVWPWSCKEYHKVGFKISAALIHGGQPTRRLGESSIIQILIILSHALSPQFWSRQLFCTAVLHNSRGLSNLTVTSAESCALDSTFEMHILYCYCMCLFVFFAIGKSTASTLGKVDAKPGKSPWILYAALMRCYINSLMQDTDYVLV